MDFVSIQRGNSGAKGEQGDVGPMPTTPWVNVKDYGALGVSSDDTVALQAALNSGAKNVYVPAGDYRFTGLAVPSYVRLFGDGPKISTLTYTPTTGDGLALADSNEYIRIEHIKIYALSGSTGTAIESNGTRCGDFEMDDFEVEGFKKGFESDCMINFRFGKGRWVGRGKTYAGGLGINVTSGSTTGTIDSNYVSAFEGGIDVQCPDTLIIRPVLENDGIGILARHVTTIVAPSFWGCTTILQTVNTAITMINPLVYDGVGAEVSDIYSVMTLDADGVKSTFVRQKSFVSAARTTNQTIGTGADTTVVFNSSVVDRMAEFDTGTGIFTAKKPGDYRVSATVYWSTSVAATILLVKNSTTISLCEFPSMHSNFVDGFVSLARGDTLKIVVNQGSGTSKDIYGGAIYNHFEIEEK